MTIHHDEDNQEQGEHPTQDEEEHAHGAFPIDRDALLDEGSHE